jgi:hypothetical protein
MMLQDMALRFAICLCILVLISGVRVVLYRLCAVRMGYMLQYEHLILRVVFIVMAGYTPGSTRSHAIAVHYCSRRGSPRVAKWIGTFLF